MSQSTKSEISTSSSAAPRATASLGAGLPVEVPEGHVGPVVIPGSNRQIWWTGRVAIGLRYERHAATRGAVTESALWVQDLMLSGRKGLGTSARL